MTFDEFVAARMGALVRYTAVITCDSHLAEDILQDVLVKAQARWSRIARTEAPEWYVRRMILNEFLSWRRRWAARQIPLSNAELDDTMSGVGDETALVDQRDALLRVIASLPPKQRAAVALRFYEDLPDSEIAELLGCRAVTVRSHISRALSSMRMALSFPVSAPTLGG